MLRPSDSRLDILFASHYPDWFDTWGGKQRTGNLSGYLGGLEFMLKGGMSFSIYMAHGGTSFELWSGADRPFRPDTSRYVETMGRVNFSGEMFDRKGLFGLVQFVPATGGAATDLKGWEVSSLPLDGAELAALRFQGGPANSPAFWRSSFDVASIGDTFLDLHSWGKGVVWVNVHCLGRFWNIGPTQTMYCPGPWLKAERNEVIVLDLLGPREPTMAGLTKPNLDELHPELDFALRKRGGGTFDTRGIAPVAEGSFTAQIQ